MRARVLVVLVALGVSGAALAGGLTSMVVRHMAPKRAFDEETPPPAPDYADPANWSALPERTDLADRAPAGAAAVDQMVAQTDVFYIHPTSFLGGHWNGPTDDDELNEATDRVATGIQASVFSGCCAVYAPRYRQSNGLPLVRQSSDGDKALDLAYQDVRRAFLNFLERRGTDRPFILASHSQGTAMAQRLLAEEIAGNFLASRLVAAYLIGGPVTEEWVASLAPHISPCASPDQLHCVVAWNARRVGYIPSEMELALPAGQHRLCTNPLSWRADGAHVGADGNLGAVFLETQDQAPRPAFADAQCVDGTLVVSQVQEAPRDFMSRLLDRALGKGNLHPVEYQIYFMNLRDNASVRIAAWGQEYLYLIQ